MQVPPIFKVLALAASIAAASAVGFGATRSSFEAYEKSAQVAQSLHAGCYFKAPAKDDNPDIGSMAPKFFVAFVLGRNAIRHPRQIFDHDPWANLQPLLSNYEYQYLPSAARDDVIHTILIRQPEAIWDLERLRSDLDRYALFWAFDDGSGYLTMSNVRQGRSDGKSLKKAKSYT